MVKLEKIIERIKKEENPQFGEEERKELVKVFNSCFRKGHSSEELKKKLGDENFDALARFYKEENWDYYALSFFGDLDEDKGYEYFRDIFANYILVDNSKSTECPKFDDILRPEQLKSVQSVFWNIVEFIMIRNMGKGSIVEILTKYYDFNSGLANDIEKLILSKREELQRVVILRYLSRIKNENN